MKETGADQAAPKKAPNSSPRTVGRPAALARGRSRRRCLVAGAAGSVLLLSACGGSGGGLGLTANSTARSSGGSQSSQGSTAGTPATQGGDDSGHRLGDTEQGSLTMDGQSYTTLAVTALRVVDPAQFSGEKGAFTDPQEGKQVRFVAVEFKAVDKGPYPVGNGIDDPNVIDVPYLALDVHAGTDDSSGAGTDVPGLGPGFFPEDSSWRLDPGGQRTGWMIAEVPVGEKPTSVELILPPTSDLTWTL